MFCKYCGQEISADAVFCENCGKNQKDNNATSTQTAYIPPMRKVVVNRTTNFGGGGQKYDIIVDGVFKDVLKNGESISFNVTANESHTIYAELSSAFAQNYKYNIDSRMLEIFPGTDTVTFKLSPSNSLSRGAELKQVGGSSSGAVEKSGGGGCYIATCVYGSYDCPQVWTLRRYRDFSLAKTWYGRAFIHCYYSVSPSLVKWFGEKKWFRNLWKTKLDKMVKKLYDNGFENTPYND